MKLIKFINSQKMRFKQSLFFKVGYDESFEKEWSNNEQLMI